MKHLSKTLIFLCLLFPTKAPAFARCMKTIYKNTRSQQRGQIIELKMDVDETSRNAPLEELVAALQHNPNVSQFKISWIAVVGGGNYKGVAVYNRARKTVNLYAYETFEETIYRYHRLYSKVGEAELVQVSQRHKIDTADDNGPSVFCFFDDLTKYGCQQQKLDAH